MSRSASKTNHKARLLKLSQKWVSLGRHPSRRNMPEVRETFERCAAELLKEITDA